MSLKSLLKNQTLKIDNHQRGTGLANDWETNGDIHIDKITKEYRVNGKPTIVQIRIPINSDKPITCEIGGRKSDIPKKLENEIKNALNDNAKRKPFIDDLVKTIRNYNEVMNSEKNAKEAIERLAKHFDLNWTEQEIATYANKQLIAIIRNYEDKSGNRFYVSFSQRYIKLGEIDAWSKNEIYLNKIFKHD